MSLPDILPSMIQENAEIITSISYIYIITIDNYYMVVVYIVNALQRYLIQLQSSHISVYSAIVKIEHP